MRMIHKIENMLTPDPRLSALADPVFRVLTSLIFIIGGLGHFGQHGIMLERMKESPWWETINLIGDPSWLLWLSGAAFIVAGVTLTLGWMTRLSAIILFVTLVPVTIAVHIAPGHVGPLFKNIAIMGALIFLYAHGAGHYALDNRNKQRG